MIDKKIAADAIKKNLEILKERRNQEFTRNSKENLDKDIAAYNKMISDLEK